jgi:DtxR family transcriptional regulator, Mn-dependent transcriptional regulator
VFCAILTNDKVCLIICEANLSNSSVSIEDYLGAIFRLQSKDGQPLPLGELQEYFGFSPISIHEMVQKLDQRGLVEYLPYKGVRLTPHGSMTAAALVRRHRIWERFLADSLLVSTDEAHKLAHDLEHAAPDWITERLYTHLGQPEACPHGNAIDESETWPGVISLDKAEPGMDILLTRISPENENSLQAARDHGLVPGVKVRIVVKDGLETAIEIQRQMKKIKPEDLAFFWGMDISDGS